MIKKFIDGKYNLIFSYWVIYAFSATVVIIPSFFIEGPFLALAYFIFAILYNCVVLIGTWRSSTYYIQDKKKQKQSPFWGYAAKVGLVLGWMFVANVIIEAFKAISLAII
jgi:cell division protein FtsX